MARSFASQQTRLIPETTYGTTPGSPTIYSLTGFGVIPSTVFDTQTVRPAGQILASGAVINDESTTGSVEGAPDYNGIYFILRSMFGAATTTTPATGTTSKQHVFTWDGITPLVPKSYSHEWGETGAANAQQSTGFVFNAFSIGGSREGGFDLGGSGFGKAATMGATFTAGTPTAVASQFIFPRHGDVYLDTTWLTAGTTKLLQLFNVGVDIPDRFARTRPINSTGSSDGVVEAEGQEPTATLAFALDAAELPQFTSIRAGTLLFPQIRFTGPIIETTIAYSLKVDLSLVWTGVGDPSNTQSLATREWTGALVRDPVSSVAAKFTLVNNFIGGF